jgi:TorA maturation chaperone TorD
MNDFERRIRQLIDQSRTKFTGWWEALTRRSGSSADLRKQASAQAQRAASAVKDLRDSDAAKRAASALTDLRQRDSVRKAEESAKRALHDLRSGHGDSDSAS